MTYGVNRSLDDDHETGFHDATEHPDCRVCQRQRDREPSEPSFRGGERSAFDRDEMARTQRELK